MNEAETRAHTEGLGQAKHDALTRAGASGNANVLGMCAMQARPNAKRGEQTLLIKSPLASGKSRALLMDMANGPLTAR